MKNACFATFTHSQGTNGSFNLFSFAWSEHTLTHTHTFCTLWFCKDAKWPNWPKSLMNWILNANNRMNYDDDYKSTWVLLFSNWLSVATRISNRCLCSWCWYCCVLFVFVLSLFAFVFTWFCVCKSARKQSIWWILSQTTMFNRFQIYSVMSIYRMDYFWSMMFELLING